jgi:hypothetical protein
MRRFQGGIDPPVPPFPAVAQQFDESVQVRVLGEKRPIEPTNLAVVAVGVVVAALRWPRFVTHDNHAHPQRE